MNLCENTYGVVKISHDCCFHLQLPQFLCEKLNIDGLYNKKQAKRLNILPTKNCFISNITFLQHSPLNLRPIYFNLWCSRRFLVGA
jgi:hypothetical protein